MEQQPLTSVISVSYFTGPILNKMIESVLTSTVPVELILVNNGNTPEVEKALKQRAEQDERITFISGHGNIGFAQGCNRGAKEASGKYLLFLNPDSILPADAIEKLQAVTANTKPNYMLGARLQDEDGIDQRGSRRALLTPKTAFVEAFHLQKYFPEHRLNMHEGPVPTKVTPVPAISGALMFLDEKNFRAINGFDEGYFLHVEDLDFCLRFRRSGGEIYFVPNVIVKHVGGTSNVTSEFIEKCKARSFIRYFHQNFSHVYPQPVLWVLDLMIMARLAVKIWLPKLLLISGGKKVVK